MFATVISTLKDRVVLWNIGAMPGVTVIWASGPLALVVGSQSITGTSIVPLNSLVPKPSGSVAHMLPTRRYPPSVNASASSASAVVVALVTTWLTLRLSKPGSGCVACVRARGRALVR